MFGAVLPAIDNSDPVSPSSNFTYYGLVSRETTDPFNKGADNGVHAAGRLGQLRILIVEMGEVQLIASEIGTKQFA